MNATPEGAASYVREVLRLYGATPTVTGHLRPADRALARRLYDQGVPLYVVRQAFIIGSARRVLHNAFSATMPLVRSLHYFLPIVKEVLERPPGYREIDQLTQQLRARGAAW